MIPSAAILGESPVQWAIAPDSALLPLWVLAVVGVMLCLACLAALIRTLRGPTLADRVVALDLFGFLAICALLLLAIATGQANLLWIALVSGLILFLGTIAFAAYLEREARS